MSPFLEQHIIIDDEEVTKFCITNKVTDNVKLSNGKALISYFKQELDKKGNFKITEMDESLPPITDYRNGW